MAQTPRIKKVCKLRPEVERGELLDVVKLHLVNKPGSTEARADVIRRITYPSQALQQLLEAVGQKLTGKREKGTFLIGGSYGTGKSHNLLVAYHIFRAPKQGAHWIAEWGIPVELPETCRVVVVNALGERPELLWEPIFSRLGREDLNEEAGDYPSIDQVRSLAENGPVLIIVDEIVPWYEAIDEQRQVRTRNFLQVLTEVADEAQTPIAFVCSILRTHPELNAVLHRHEPYNQDLSQQPEQDKSEIVRFRLLEGIDYDAIDTLARAYEEAYGTREHLMDSSLWHRESVRDRIKRFYPFHPQLMEALFNAYQVCKEFQNMRGVLYLLGSMLRHKAAEADLLLTGDLDPRIDDIASDLRQMDMELVARCIEDMNRCQSQAYADRILPTILVHSFLPEQKAGATIQQILLGTMRSGDNPNDVEQSVRAVATEVAWFVHAARNKYVFKRTQNLPVVVSSEARRRLNLPQAEEAIVEVLCEVVSEHLRPGVEARGWKEVIVFEGRADDFSRWAQQRSLWDQPKIKLVVALRSLDESELFELTRGGKYRNTAIWVTPRERNLLRDHEVRFRVMRIAVCDELSKQASKQKDTERQRAVRAERDRAQHELYESLQVSYGSWLKLQPPSQTISPGMLAIREVPLDKFEASLLQGLVSHHYTEEVFRDHFRGRLEKAGEQGISFGALVEECLKVPGYPLVLTPQLAVRGVVLLLNEGEDGAEAVAEYEQRTITAQEFERLTEDRRARVTLWLSKFYTETEPPPPPPPPDKEEQVEVVGVISPSDEDESIIQPPPPPTVLQKTTVEAPSPASLQDKAERTLGQLGQAKIVSYKVILSSGEIEGKKLLDLLGKLPEIKRGASYIVEVEYEERNNAAGDG